MFTHAWQDVWHLVGQPGHAEDAAAVAVALAVVLQRKNRVVDALASSRNDTGNGLRGRLAALALRGPEQQEPAVWRAELAALQAQASANETEQGLQGPARTEAAVTLAAVQAALPEGAILLEIVVFRPHDVKQLGRGDAWGLPQYGVYALRRAGRPTFRVLGPKAAVDALLAPDGGLALAPLHLLPDAKGEPWLVNSLVTYPASGRELLRPTVPGPGGAQTQGVGPALVLAGAESLVMSLWSVDDEATRDLMVAFYRNLGAGLGRGEALRQAQLALRAVPGREAAFHWGAFVLAGAWR